MLSVRFTKKSSSISIGDGSCANNNNNNGSSSSITVFTSIMSNQTDKEGDSSDMREDEVIISIKDRGTGIDPDIKNKLFSKFATKSDTGSGLGLFISKGIVEAHGGKVWAQNNTDGIGATFAFSLPLSK